MSEVQNDWQVLWSLLRNPLEGALKSHGDGAAQAGPIVSADHGAAVLNLILKTPADMATLVGVNEAICQVTGLSPQHDPYGTAKHSRMSTEQLYEITSEIATERLLLRPKIEKTKKEWELNEAKLVSIRMARPATDPNLQKNYEQRVLELRDRFQAMTHQLERLDRKLRAVFHLEREMQCLSELS